MQEASIYKGITMYIIHPTPDIRYHYWTRANGMVYASERNIEISADDEEYQAWLVAGGLPTAYPKDKNGNENVAELDAVLAPYGLRASQLSAEEQRRAAYEKEADPLFEEAQFYQTEADGHKALGNNEQAAEAEAKALEFKKQYAQKKKDIRERLPDTQVIPAVQNAPVERYSLSASGVYHKTTCGYASANGTLLTLDEIAARYPAVTPCARCNPPPMFYLTDIDIYHTSGCPGLNDPGQWITWDDICTHHKTAEACADCLVK